MGNGFLLFFTVYQIIGICHLQYTQRFNVSYKIEVVGKATLKCGTNKHDTNFNLTGNDGKAVSEYGTFHIFANKKNDNYKITIFYIDFGIMFTPNDLTTKSCSILLGNGNQNGEKFPSGSYTFTCPNSAFKFDFSSNFDINKLNPLYIVGKQISSDEKCHLNFSITHLHITITKISIDEKSTESNAIRSTLLETDISTTRVPTETISITNSNQVDEPVKPVQNSKMSRILIGSLTPIFIILVILLIFKLIQKFKEFKRRKTINSMKFHFG